MAHAFPDPAAQEALAAAVARFSAQTRFPIAFGGYESDGTTTITAAAGNRTDNLEGLEIQLHRGLGGRAMVERRPRFASNYARSRQITHDYDPQILSEGIVTLFAMPVVLGGATRAVLYGGTRGGTGPSSSFMRDASEVACALAEEIRIQDEVLRRVRERTALHRSNPEPWSGPPGAVLEGLRSGQAELRRIMADVTDPELRARLSSLDERFSRIGSADAPRAEEVPKLSPRELDVVSFAAIGCSNAEIGVRLGLAENTVKSYLAAAMSKLGVSNRHAAVATARSLGLIL